MKNRRLGREPAAQHSSKTYRVRKFNESDDECNSENRPGRVDAREEALARGEQPYQGIPGEGQRWRKGVGRRTGASAE